MNYALILLFAIVSIFALLFLRQRYRMATPAQRTQIIWAAGGAVAVAVALFLVFLTR